jgi:hypothetical protein
MGWTIYEDYIMRQIRIAAQTLLRIIGLREAGDLEAARQEMGEVYRRLIGLDVHLFLRLDSKAGAALLARPEKMAVMADLLHEEAEIRRAGRQDNPQDMDRRALEYALEAFMTTPSSEENASRINKLMKYVPLDTLDARYRQALEKL